jgi:hypothetical protein
MSEKPISPLRRRMIEDMTVRNIAFATQRNYIRAVKKLAAFLHRSSDTASAEDLRRFQLHLTETGARPTTINGTVTGLQFFASCFGESGGRAPCPCARLRGGQGRDPSWRSAPRARSDGGSGPTLRSGGRR